MNIAIHPQWYPEAETTCTCGNIFTVGSTKQVIHVDICSRCHPFFTGEMKYVDTKKRVEKFQTKAAKAQTSWSPAGKKAKAAKKKAGAQDDSQPKTLKEMLMNLSKQ